MGRGADTIGGAASGAAIGSVGGPWGAAAGGLIGAGIGFFGGGGNSAPKPRYGNYTVNNYDKQYGNYGRFADMAEARQAPQAQYSGQFRDEQGGYLRMMRREAQGNGIGQALVRSQAQSAADRNMSQQMGMAASARPGQTAMAARNAALAGGIGNSAIGEQAAQAGGQMALGAQSQYGQALAGARDQDENMNRFNVTAQQNQYQMNDNAALSAYDSRMRLSQMDQEGRMKYDAARMGRAPDKTALDYMLPLGRDMAGMRFSGGGSQGQALQSGGPSYAYNGTPGATYDQGFTNYSPYGPRQMPGRRY